MDSIEDQINGASSLDLSGRSLETLPESLANLTALTKLVLVGNRLSVVPEWLRNPTVREHSSPVTTSQ